MKVASTSALVLLLAAGAAAPAIAQDEPRPSGDQWHFEISPRIWFRTETIPVAPVTLTAPGVTALGARANTAASYPMYGGSVAIEPPGTQSWTHPTDFVVTAYAGEGQWSGNAVAAAGTVGLGIGIGSSGSRLDVEVLGRTALDPSRTARLIWGVRWTRFNEKDRNNFVTPGFLPGGVAKIDEDDVFLEGGAQFAAPIGDSPHVLFGSFTLGLGYGTSSRVGIAAISDYFPGLIDTTAGYQYTVNESFRPYLRYRFQTLAYFRGGSLLTNNLRVIHGPELGFSVRF